MYSRMGNHDLELPLEALEISRRVLGSHPQTQESAGNLGTVLFTAGDETAAAPLLREAVQGLMAVYRAEHPLVGRFQSFLDLLVARQATTVLWRGSQWGVRQLNSRRRGRQLKSRTGKRSSLRRRRCTSAWRSAAAASE